MRQKVVAIVGPTGSGKTELAQQIALHLKGEVLSCDSMQVYNELTVGTAKLKPSEMLVPHHGINITSYAKPYSVAEFQIYARKVIDDCFSRGVTPIVCGGSGLYIRAALDVMDFPAGEQILNPVRKKYEEIAAAKGADTLYQLLLERDPAAEQFIHAHNVKRVIRALEMVEEGTLYSEQVQGFKERVSFYPSLYLGLRFNRETLYDRINQRVLQMMDKGLMNEVEQLYHSGLKESLTAAQAIGYKELFEVIEGTAQIGEAVESIQRSSRRYAKRQMTWFNSDKRINWIDCEELSSEQILQTALNILANV